MSLQIKDRVAESSTTTGAGTLTLDGAITGYQAFIAVGNGNTCNACVYAVDAYGNPSGAWEVFAGTYTASGTTLSRTSVLASSNGGSAVNFGAGTKFVILVAPASQLVQRDQFAANTFPAAASAGGFAFKPVTDFGLALVDSADAGAVRSLLSIGLGSLLDDGNGGFTIPTNTGAGVEGSLFYIGYQAGQQVPNIWFEGITCEFAITSGNNFKIKVGGIGGGGPTHDATANCFNMASSGEISIATNPNEQGVSGLTIQRNPDAPYPNTYYARFLNNDLSRSFDVGISGTIGHYGNAAPTNGQLLIGGTAAGDFQAATITQGAGITITNGAHAITIAATGGGGSPGGADTQVQYNASGSFAGSSNFTFDGTSVTVGGVVLNGVTASVVVPSAGVGMKASGVGQQMKVDGIGSGIMSFLNFASLTIGDVNGLHFSVLNNDCAIGGPITAFGGATLYGLAWMPSGAGPPSGAPAQGASFANKVAKYYDETNDQEYVYNQSKSAWKKSAVYT